MIFHNFHDVSSCVTNHHHHHHHYFHDFLITSQCLFIHNFHHFSLFFLLVKLHCLVMIFIIFHHLHLFSFFVLSTMIFHFHHVSTFSIFIVSSMLFSSFSSRAQVPVCRFGLTVPESWMNTSWLHKGQRLRSWSRQAPGKLELMAAVVFIWICPPRTQTKPWIIF